MKIKVKDQIIELSGMCRWEIRSGVLYNLNTKHDEGVDGDIIEYSTGIARYRGHVKGYTCYQFIETYEWGGIILSAADYNATFTHQTKVEEVKD